MSVSRKFIDRLRKSKKLKITVDLKPSTLLLLSLCWLSIMFVGFLLAFSITDRAWQRFQTNPMFTSLVLNQNRIKITFPSVSVCPESAVDDEKVLAMIKSLGTVRNDTKELKEFLSAIPNFSYGNKGLRSIIMSQSVEYDFFRLNVEDPRALAFKLAKSCDKLFKSCRFKGEIVDCSKAFRPIFSEKGFCYSFNSRVYGKINAE